MGLFSWQIVTVILEQLGKYCRGVGIELKVWSISVKC